MGEQTPVTTELLDAIQDAFNRHDVEGILSYFADDCEWLMARGPMPREGRRCRGETEIGEVLATELLGLTLAEARQPGYDALGPDGRRVQIKARCIPKDAKPGQRIGQIRFDHDWDTVVLILMNEDFGALEVWEAGRDDVRRELERPGSKARNERGALSVHKFKSVAELRWSAERSDQMASD